MNERKFDLELLHKAVLTDLKAQGVNPSFHLKEEVDENGHTVKPIKWPACVLEFRNGSPDDTKTTYNLDRYLVFNVIDDYDSAIRIYGEVKKIYAFIENGIHIDGFEVEIIKNEEEGPYDDNSFKRMDLTYQIKIMQIMEV